MKKQNPYAMAKKVSLHHSLHHSKALKKLSLGVLIGIAIPTTIFAAKQHQKK